MYTFSASEITFECDEEISWTVDGEFGGKHQKANVINLQKQVEIMVPEESMGELMEHPEELEIVE